MARMTRNRLLLALLAAPFAGLVACSPEPLDRAVSPPAGWPEELSDLSVVWTAEAGIELTSSGPSVVTRAYVESYNLAMATGDEKYLYPGFAQSVNANSDGGLFDGTQELWPDTSRPTTWVGTFRQHILRLDESGDEVSVIGCVYTFESGTLTGDNFKANIGPAPNSGAMALRLELKAPQKAEPLPPQEGPSRAPFTKVFGGWKITTIRAAMCLHRSGRTGQGTMRLADHDPEPRTVYGNSCPH